MLALETLNALPIPEDERAWLLAPDLENLLIVLEDYLVLWRLRNAPRP